jgi:methylenetetrahydrofolate dehydrogenase (NADP+)/methenyltetrahydrofolate cyclohydrolase
MTLVIDPADVATGFRDQLRDQLAAEPEPLSLVGVLSGDHAPSKTYASYAERACRELGIRFELRHVARLNVEATLHDCNSDPRVDGVMVYYPIFGTEQDNYLRDSIDPGKDIEGLHSTWARRLYENRRFVDAARTKKAILPCTPLAILKLIEAAGAFLPQARPLEGRTVTIFNRSEVVGRPLASMMAHDGARVFSFDIDGPLLFGPASDPEASHTLAETRVDRSEGLRQSEIVITGVPSRQFPLVQASELREGCLCVNFSTYKNFSEDIIGKAGSFIPRVGPMTVLMVIRNALRLRHNAGHFG